MNKAEISKLLQRVKDNEIEVETAMGIIEDLPYKEMGFAKIDNHHASIINKL
jgi:NCAIR mutase (PurE)-related protein